MNRNKHKGRMIAIMNLNMSYQLKLEILNAVRKRNRMFAIWIELCGTISFLILLTVSLINATDLRVLIFKSDEHLPYIVTILSIIVSVSFDFVFKADKYKKNVELIDKIIKYSSMKCRFNKYFVNAIPLITEMDIARARFDYCKKLKVHKKLHLQIDEDKLQPVDLLTMNRQLYIIIALILEIVLFVALLGFLADRRIAVSILMVMVMIGLIFMIIDSGEMKRAEKKVEEIYGQENYRKEDKDKMKKFYYISLMVGILIAVLITATTAFAQEDESAYIMYDDAYSHFDNQGNFIYAITYNDNEDACGLIDANGNVILSPKYKRVECIDEEELIFLVTDENTSFVMDIYGYKLSEYDLSGHGEVYLFEDDVLFIQKPMTTITDNGYPQEVSYQYLAKYDGTSIIDSDKYINIDMIGRIEGRTIVGCSSFYGGYSDIVDINGYTIVSSKNEEYYAYYSRRESNSYYDNEITGFWGVNLEYVYGAYYECKNTIVELNKYDISGNELLTKNFELEGYAAVSNMYDDNITAKGINFSIYQDNGREKTIILKENGEKITLDYDDAYTLGEDYIIVDSMIPSEVGIVDRNGDFLIPIKESNYGISINTINEELECCTLQYNDNSVVTVLSNGMILDGGYDIEEWQEYYFLSERNMLGSTYEKQYLLSKDDFEIAYTFNGEYTLGPNNILYNIDGDSDYQEGSKILAIDEDKNLIELQIPYSDINDVNDIDYYLERFIDGKLLVNEYNSNWSGFVYEDGTYERFIESHCRLVPKYSYQEYTHDYFVKYKGANTYSDPRREGIVDAKGNEILPCEYTGFYTIDYHKPGNLNESIPCETGVLTTTNSNATSNQDEIHYYFDSHFKLLFQSSRTENGAEDYYYCGDGLWRIGKHDYDNEVSLYGLINQNGTTILPCVYSSCVYSNGYVVCDTGDSVKIYDVKNKTFSKAVTLTNPKYTNISCGAINEFGYGILSMSYPLPYLETHSDYFMVDIDGNIVFNEKLDDYNGRTYKNGHAIGEALPYSNRKTEFYNSDYYYNTTDFYTINGTRYFCAQKERNGYWGVLDEYNNLIVPFVLYSNNYRISVETISNIVLYSAVDKKYFTNPIYKGNTNAEAFDEKSKIIITSYDIENDEIDSLSNRVVVLDGGTAHAYYKVTYDNGKPFANREIIYKYSGNYEPIITCTDKNGFLKVVAEDVYIPYGYEDYQHWFAANILTRDGKFRDNVSGSISFIVEVLPRPYTQEFTLTLGGEVEAGTGLGVELGAIDADVLKASAEFSKTGTIGVKYKHNSDGSIDLVLTSSTNSTLKGEGKAGLFGSIWDGEDAPSISVGKNGSVSSGSTFGTQIELKNFFDKSNPNYKKNGTIAGIFILENLFVSQIMPASVERILNRLYDEISGDEITTLSEEVAIKTEGGASASVDISMMSGGYEAKATILNGKNASIVKNSIVYNPTNKMNGNWTKNSSLTTNTTSDFFNVAIEQNFTSDKDGVTPTFSLGELNTQSSDAEIERKVTAEYTEGNVSKITLNTQWSGDDATNGWSIIGSNEKTSEILSFEITGNALNEALQSGTYLNDYVYLNSPFFSDATMTDVFLKVGNLKNPIVWSKSKKTQKIVEPEFDISLGAGIKVGLGIKLKGVSAESYEYQRGKSSANSFITTDLFDGVIQPNKKEALDFVDVVNESVMESCSDIVSSVAGSINDTIENVDAWISGNSTINATLSYIGLGSQTFSLMTVNEDDISLFGITENNIGFAETIGEAYFINIEDEIDIAQEDVKLNISYQNNVINGDESNLAIYLWNGATGLYTKLNSTVDISNKVVTAKINKAGQYILAIDTTKPVISKFTAETFDGTTTIEAIITDDFSSIDEKSIQLTIDNQIVVDFNNITQYFNAQLGNLVYSATNLLDGEHQAILLAKDSSGNVCDAKVLDFATNSSKAQIVSVSENDCYRNEEYGISAEIDGDIKSVTVAYRIDDQIAYTTAPMEYNGEKYEAIVNNITESIEYYIIVIDNNGNTIISNTIAQGALSRYIPGDADSNEKVNSDDAIYMLKHTLLPERYPIICNGDLNGDGVVNSDDAIYLLKHTLLPERYPLSK